MNWKFRPYHIFYALVAIIFLGFVFPTDIKADHVPTHPSPLRCYAIADGGDALLWTERLEPPPYPHTGNYVGDLDLVGL